MRRFYELVELEQGNMSQLQDLTYCTPILGRLSGDPRIAFDLHLALARGAWTPDPGFQQFKQLFPPNHFQLTAEYWEFDDLVVTAGVELIQAQPIPEAGVLADELLEIRADQRRNELPDGAPRSTQFLREVAQLQAARTTVARVLAASLPVELVLMVVTAVAGTHQELVARWSTPRPEQDDNCQYKQWHDITLMDPAMDRDKRGYGGCDRQTCHVRTWTEWRPDEHRWVSIHGSRPEGMMAECPRENCQGHHDEDFGSAVWKPAPAEDLRMREVH